MNEWTPIALFGLNAVVLLIQALIGLVIKNFNKSIDRIDLSAKEGIKEAKGTATEARDMAISQEQRIITLENIIDKLATREGQTALSTKIDNFHKLVNDTANTLITKHVNQEGEYRKTVIAANASAERLEKKNKELEDELKRLKRQK